MPEKKRLPSMDVLRGFAIVMMLVIHRIHYHWPQMNSRESLRTEMVGWQTPFLIMVIVLFTMAGVFYVISGLVNSYTKARRLAEEREGVRSIVRGGVFYGIFLLALHYMQRFFLVNGFVADLNGFEPQFAIGQLNGWLRNGGPVPFRWSQFTDPGTLSLVGLMTISLSLTLGALLRKGGLKKKARNLRVLALLGILVLFLYPILASFLNPLYEQAYQSGRYGTAYLLGHWTQTFGLFPYLGFAFFGAMVGLAMAQDSPKEKVLRWLGRGTWLSIAIALFGATFLMLGDGGVHRGSSDTSGVAAYLGLGIFLFFQRISLKHWEFAAEKKRKVRLDRLLWVRRFGRLSLTVYVLEPLLAELLNLFLRAVFGQTWTQSFPAVLLMGLLCVLIWHGLLRFWQRLQFKGSLEWMLGLALSRITDQGKGRIDFTDLVKKG